jgi:hypothetical protein
MSFIRLKSALVGALLALIAVITHAGEPKQIYYGTQLANGQMIHSTDCAETVLAGMHESCPTAFMAEGYPGHHPARAGKLAMDLHL